MELVRGYSPLVGYIILLSGKYAWIAGCVFRKRECHFYVHISHECGQDHATLRYRIKAQELMAGLREQNITRCMYVGIQADNECAGQ